MINLMSDLSNDYRGAQHKHISCNDPLVTVAHDTIYHVDRGVRSVVTLIHYIVVDEVKE